MKSERIPYPNAFSGSPRRRMFARIFLVVYTGLVALGVYEAYNAAGGFHDEALLFYSMYSVASWLFTTSFCFFLFAPSQLSREAFEELLLTQTPKSAFAKTFMRPPIGIFLVTAGINLFGYMVLLVPYWLDGASFHWWEIFPLMLSLIISAQIVSIAAAIRVWSGAPRSVVRLFLLTPLLAAWKALAIFFMMIAMAQLLDRFPSHPGTEHLIIGIFTGGCVSLALLFLWQAIRHRELLLFCEADPEPCMTACWTANEHWDAAANRRLLRASLRNYRAIGGALLVTFLCMAGLAAADAFLPLGVFHVEDEVFTKGLSPLDPGFVLTTVLATIMMSGIFAVAFVAFMSRSESSRRVPVYSGGIIPVICYYATPPVIFFFVYTAGRFMVLSANARWVRMKGSIIWNADTAYTNVVGFIVAMSIIAFVVALMLPRDRRLRSLLLALLFVIGVPALFGLISMPPNSGSFYTIKTIGQCSLMFLGAWFAGFGFSWLAARIHREVAHLPRFAFNTDEE